MQLFKFTTFPPSARGDALETTPRQGFYRPQPVLHRTLYAPLARPQHKTQEMPYLPPHFELEQVQGSLWPVETLTWSRFKGSPLALGGNVVNL